MADDGRAAFVPDDFAVPWELVTSEFRLEPLGPQHNEADYAAWTSSIDHIRATPGFPDGRWPYPMPPERNLADLRRHAEDFANRAGFTYTVRFAKSSACRRRSARFRSGGIGYGHRPSGNPGVALM